MPRVNLAQSEIALYTFGKLCKSPITPPATDYLIDVAGMRDPMSNRGFKLQFSDGRPGLVQKFVSEDPRYNAIEESVKFLAHIQLKSKAASGKWLTIAFRDHHGKWIAPAVGELVADSLSREGYKVHLFHADLT
jgi:hypothetical protein